MQTHVSPTGAGDGWFKLMDNGYNADTDKWCTDRLNENNGRLSVQLPKGLEGGNYLARPEVVALHNATEGGAQFYTGCAQIYLESTGNLVPESTIAIPGPDYVKAGEPSVKFNIYMNKNADYQVPGPAVAKFTRSSNNAAEDGGARSRKAEGIVPETCIAQNANWCGVEVPSYSNEDGCWKAGEDCWAQGKKCWDEAPATGGSVCELWSDKCTALNDACKAKNFNGPPNKGKVITPKRATIEIGALIAPVAGGEVKEADSKPATTSQAEIPPSSTEEPSFISSVPLLSFEGGLYDAPLTTSEPSPSASSAKVTQPSFTSSVPLLSFEGGLYDSPLTTLRTSTKPASSSKDTTTDKPAAPAPTGSSCREGYVCVTEWNVEVVTETKYVTLSVNAPGYRAGRRRG